MALSRLRTMGLVTALAGGVGGFAAPALAVPIVSLEASAPGFSTQQVSAAPDSGTFSLALSDYSAGGSRPGYSGTITAVGYDLASGEVNISLSAQLNAAAYISTNTPLPLTIALTETGLPGQYFWGFDNALTAIFLHHANTVAYSVYVDPSDTAFGTADLLYSTSVTGPGTFSPTSSSALGIGTAFSLTEIMKLTPVASSTNALTPTLDGAVTAAVPEPAALGLFALAVLATAVVRRPRRAT